MCPPTAPETIDLAAMSPPTTRESRDLIDGVLGDHGRDRNSEATSDANSEATYFCSNSRLEWIFSNFYFFPQLLLTFRKQFSENFKNIRCEYF